jgi:hypothetical protein
MHMLVARTIGRLVCRKILKLVPLIARARVLAGQEVQAIAADRQKSPGLKSRP